MSTQPRKIFVVTVGGAPVQAYGLQSDAKEFVERNYEQYTGREILVVPVTFTEYATWGLAPA